MFYSNRAEPASKETMYLLSQPDSLYPHIPPLGSYPHIPPLGSKSARQRKAAKMLGDIYRKAEDSGYDKAKKWGSFCPFSVDTEVLP